MRRSPGLIFLGLALITMAAGQNPLQANYQQVLLPPLQQAAVVERAAFTWNALHFQLRAGELALGAPLAGNVTTAVFRGQGELDLAPPNAIARQQMQFLLKQDSLALPFTEAVFRFARGAGFVKALGAEVHFQPIVGHAELVSTLAERAQVVRQRGLIGAARTLLAVDGGATSSTNDPGWFLAALKTGSGWVMAQYDPLDSEQVEVSQYLQQPAFGLGVFHDIYAHFPGGAAAGAPGTVAPLPPPATLNDYDLDLRIPADLDLQTQAALTVTARRPGRGLLLQLDPHLRVSSARIAGGAPIEFVQPLDPGRYPAPFYQGNWVYLRLPQPLEPGSQIRIQLNYSGKYVIQKVGNGNFFAQSSGWYPGNLYGPPFQRATYHLRFEHEKRYTLVATGVRQSEQTQGDETTSVWTTPVPLTVAGFAMGDYSERSKAVTLPDGQKVTVNVLTNNSPDDVLASINLANQFGSMGASQFGNNQTPLPMGTLDPRNLAPVALAQVGAALQFMTALYGPYPYQSLTVVPIPFAYGQGWPGLLYLSDLSFLDSTQLDLLGVGKAGLDQLSDTFRAHEASHQWWGHRVGWASYHDQWLSEGFANASALFFQLAEDGENAGLDTLRQWRLQLQSKSRMGHVHGLDGPLWLGQRLSSSQDPGGYQIITYDKGGYVLYMLRQMMLDTRSQDPNAAFVAMMKDFTSTYANRNASTADFQRVVEKHMTPAMNIAGNGSMDWFFQKYVYGTGIPTLQFHAAWAPDGARTRLTMTVANPDAWVGLLPVYIWQGKKFVRGQINVRQPEETISIELGFRPTRVVANQFLDMLVNVNQ